MDRLFLENSIGKIIKKMDEGILSPADVTDVALENIREFNGQYFPWVVYGDEELFERERRDSAVRFGSGQGHLLNNIPVGVKDIYNTVEFPTQMGSPLWKDFTPGNDARAVFNLKRQGAIVVGKTVTAEFAVHTLIEKTINPHNVARTPGTSSSGSAVAIALGMVPATTATQTAGSIVRPASFCGIYGCKPSFGLIPRTGMLKTTDSLDTIGFFTIFAEDLLRMFEAMRVSGKNYPFSNAALSDTSRQTKPSDRPWKVAFVKTHTWENAYPHAKEALEKFIKKLSMDKDIEIEECELPDGMKDAHEIHATIYNKTLAYYFKQEFKKSELVSPIMNELIKDGNTTTLEKYSRALLYQEELIRQMDKFFEKYDCIISLSTAGEAPPREEIERPDPALMWTLAHLPVISVPQFVSPDGFPFGFQISARKYNDHLLFSFVDWLVANRFCPTKPNPLAV